MRQNNGSWVALLCVAGLACPAIEAFAQLCDPATHSSMLARYRFENSLADEVGNHPAEAFGGATFAASAVGQGVHIPLGGRLRLGNLHQNPVRSVSEGTVEGWVRVNQFTGTSDALFANGRDVGGAFNDGLFVGVNTAYSGNLFLAFWDGTQTRFVASGVPYSSLVGEWHWVGASWGPQGLKLWLDGEVVATDGYTGPLANPDYQTFHIGTDSHSQYAAVDVDEFRFWADQRDADAPAGPPRVKDPVELASCAGAPVQLSARILSADVPALEWQIESPPGNWTTLAEPSVALPCGGSVAVTLGAATADLTVNACAGMPPLRYRFIATNPCGSTTSAPRAIYVNGSDFNNDGDVGTDADIEAFFACLAGNCCPTCGSADFNGDGDIGTDADIESFFRVLAGGSC